MKRFRQLLRYRWFSIAVAGCITVVVYLLLSNIKGFWQSIGQFLSFFSPVIGGCVIAFLMNPLAGLYKRTLFRRIRSKKARWSLSIFLAAITFVLILALILVILIPQLIDSVSRFVGNLGSYVASLQKLLENIGVNSSNELFDFQRFIDSSENLLETIVSFISVNSSKIISVSTTAGKGVFNWFLACILSVYLLAAKQRIKNGLRRFLKAVFQPEFFEICWDFLHHCNTILNRWIIFNLIDSLIVGGATAIFMSIAGMQYIGLVAVIVAIANLWPTFGPIAGGALGGFILLMVRPLHALIFIIFTLILQFCDGYVLKPRLFGNSLGVSGLWILIAVIVGGRIFGVIGILLAIPFAAITDHIYQDRLLPALEKRRGQKKSEVPADESPPGGEKTAEEVPDTETPTT